MVVQSFAGRGEDAALHKCYSTRLAPAILRGDRRPVCAHMPPLADERRGQKGERCSLSRYRARKRARDGSQHALRTEDLTLPDPVRQDPYAPLQNRPSYEELKSMALDAYYAGCRDLALEKGWRHENIMGYVEYQFEGLFCSPAEKFMMSVILLVLSGGWHPQQDTNLRRKIIDQIAEFGLDKLLSDIRTGESEQLRHDLEILKLVSP